MTMAATSGVDVVRVDDGGKDTDRLARARIDSLDSSF